MSLETLSVRRFLYEGHGNCKDEDRAWDCGRTSDPVGGRLHVLFCDEDKDLPLDDGRNIMFLNTKGTIGELKPDMEALFSYINGGTDSIGVETGSRYVDRLDGYVQELNRDEGWRIEHMKYELSLAEKYREGRSEGFSQGEAIGLSKGRSEGFSQGVAEEKRRMVKSLREQSIPLEVIAKAASLSVEEVQGIK